MPMMGRSEGKCGKVNNEKKRKQQHTTGARWKILKKDTVVVS